MKRNVLHEHAERGLLALVDGGHVHHEVHHAVGVAPLVVVPGHHLHVVRVEHDAGVSVEDARLGLGLEVGGHERLVAVAEEALLGALGVLLDEGADVLVGGGLVEHASQVDHGHVSGRHAERHAGKLALEVRDHLGHCLGSAGGGRDDVARRATAAAPVLVGGAVHHLLGGGHGVHGGHEAHGNAVLVVDGLHHWRKAVGGAGRARHRLHVSGVGALVHAHHHHRGVVLGRSREDNLLGTGREVGGHLLLGQEGTGGLAHVQVAVLGEWDLRRVAGVGEGHFVAVDDEGIVITHLHGALVPAVDGVVLELVRLKVS